MMEVHQAISEKLCYQGWSTCSEERRGDMVYAVESCHKEWRKVTHGSLPSRSSHRLRADRLFGLDASAPVGHRLDQLADLLACALVTQVHVLVE